MNPKSTVIILFAFVVSACSSNNLPVASAISATDTEPNPITPVESAEAVVTTTSTNNALSSPTSEATETYSIIWEEVPVMPEASIQSPDNPYVYTVFNSIEACEQFYVNTMESLGWNMTYRKQSDVSEEFQRLNMDFQKGTVIVQMSFIDISTADKTIIETIVTLLKIEG